MSNFMEPKKLIDLISNNLRNFEDGNSFRLIPSKHNAFHYIVEGNFLALNRFDIPQESVKVIKWFNNFWLFLGIKFSLPNKKVGKKIDAQLQSISLSVFQGEDYDHKKHQLFRAEWDDYNSSDKEHAQPHWHITSSQAIEETFDEFANVFEMQDFLQVLKQEKQRVLDIKRIHFAMNGDWQRIGENHVHKMENEEQIVRWLQGMLAHLRTELVYCI
jgi:hypothetical protein